MSEDDQLTARFVTLLAEYGNIAELARQSGLSRRVIEYKRDGERRVTQWDVWALERAVLLRRDK